MILNFKLFEFFVFLGSLMLLTHGGYVITFNALDKANLKFLIIK